MNGFFGVATIGEPMEITCDHDFPRSGDTCAGCGIAMPGTWQARALAAEAERDKWKGEMYTALLKDWEDALADVARLRIALEKIRDESQCIGRNSHCEAIARAALGTPTILP
jgi:hypothetical protein